MKRKPKRKPKPTPKVTAGLPDERPLGIAIAFILIGLLLIAIALGYLGNAFDAWLWGIQDDPAPPWVWACGGVGLILWAVFMLVPQHPYAPPRYWAAIAGGVGGLHLVAFFVGMFFI